MSVLHDRELIFNPPGLIKAEDDVSEKERLSPGRSQEDQERIWCERTLTTATQGMHLYTII